MRKKWEIFKTDVLRYYKGIILVVLYLGIVAGVLRLPVCPLVYMTGYPCPACGITRAMILFLTGDFPGAWQMHPFFYALLAAAATASLFRYGLGRDISWMKYVIAGIIIGGIVYYIYRMAVLFPQQEPMIYYESSILGRIKKLQSLL